MLSRFFTSTSSVFIFICFVFSVSTHAAPVNDQVIAKATFDTFCFQGQVEMTTNRIQPGADFRWRSHPCPLITPYVNVFISDGIFVFAGSLDRFLRQGLEIHDFWLPIRAIQFAEDGNGVSTSVFMP